MVRSGRSAAFVAGLVALASRPTWAAPAHVSYRFHVDNVTGDLFSDHFGGSITGEVPTAMMGEISGWVNRIGRVQREFPDQGRGDFRTPAVRIRQTEGYTV